MKPKDHKIVDGGIWLSVDALREVMDYYEKKSNKLGAKGDSNGASISFGRALAISDLLLLIEEEEETK